ncbi:MAG TPA: two-component regulator propeller domain-containing protein [Lacunisphaera sp.]|nr:two-component regulator propeller domain-containing protein [Lacunisphaera sp.]
MLHPATAFSFAVLVLLAGCALSSPAGVAAQEDAFSNWRTQHGLPANKITSLVQTRDGYMWIGTFDGLVRFDGVSFTSFDSSNVPAMRDSSVTALYEDRDGRLWIGHSSGALTSLEAGRFTAHPARPDWKANVIKGIASDAAGDAWVWDDAGDLARLRDGKVLKPEPGLAPGIRQMACSPRGTIWVTSRGRLSALDRGELRPVPLDPRMSDYVQGVCASQDGGLWVVAEGKLWKRKEGGWEGPFGELSIGPTPTQALIELSDGRLVAGTSDHGAVVVTPSPWEEKLLWRATGFASDWVIALAEDHEGGLWIGTGGAGLFRSRRDVVKMLVPPDRWQGRTMLSVAPAAGGGFWAGTEGAGLYRWDGREWTNHTRDAGIRNPYVWAVTEDGRGRLWFCTGGGGLYQAAGDGFSPVPGFDLVAPHMKAIAPSRDGGVWVGSFLGLVHYADGAPRWITSAWGLPMRDVRVVLEQADGSLWVGCNGSGLFHVQGTDVRRYGKEDGLMNEFVQALHRDAGDALWIGTRSGGLSRLKAGRFFTLGLAQGLTNDSIGHITEDALGYVWMGSRGGILRVKKTELDDCADGKIARVNCLAYGLSDGLASLACSGGLQPAGGVLPDGKLLFATDAGVAVINPAELTVNPRPAPVIIESLRAGDRVLATGSLGGRTLQVPAGTTRIEIKYTGLSFAAPEKVRFKRRLEGLDQDWVEAGTERLAVYNYVPPGDYTFRVMAANNDNVWTEVPVNLAVVILPHFWQTTWFRLLGVLGLLLATASFVWVRARARLKRALELAERERVVEQERSRIARDMHDDLGAHLTRITMLSETAKRDPARAQDGLAKIYDTASSVTRAMDEIVWAINPKHDSLASLVYYLEKFSLDFLGAAGIRCRLEIPSEFPSWSPRSEVRHSLFLGLKEALNNAVRHSGADTVTIGMEMDEERCRVIISDNGNGGAPGVVRNAGRITPGNGLANLRERMRRIGGTCEVRHTAGAGTEVVLVAPRAAGGPGPLDRS